MSTQRKRAVENIASRKKTLLEKEERAITDIYGKDVFNLKTMKAFLPKNTYYKLLATIKKGESIAPEISDDVANAMKNWAINKGASHYTHWFQPLTGFTAEKHDSFIEPDLEGGVILNFSGKNLIKGEPDASSFPSGGLRATFEARGYTAWDPTSPAFIKRTENGATLCIPTAFYAYTGNSLDKKTPLLRSMQAISYQAKRLLKCFSTEVEDKVHTTLGAEQEYFLIDKEFYYSRPDLVQCGRTLFGNVPAKNQQLDDHYFGSIKSRVLKFMTDVDQKLWELGIPAKTRHNEVAPSQFEIAAQFEELNLAVDHNMLIMEVLRETADSHGFVCLLHEKPFANLNGSGKHNNWSISANGINLLNPGNNPHENAIFLTVLCSVIKAVDNYSDLLLASIAGAGNAHRLGGNEAPPAIISIFLGDQLTDVIEQIEQGGAKAAKSEDLMRVGVDTLPELPRDVTDRNRTSPFAFTGNKFEFRAVGSSHSCAGPNIVLNTIVAEVFDEIASELENYKEGTDEFNSKLQNILQDIIKNHKRVIFNGDNYSDDWVREAGNRGLPKIDSVPEALSVINSDKSQKVFTKYNVLNKEELNSRYEVFIENYKKHIQIEGELGVDIAKTIILPAIINYQNKILNNISKLKELNVAGEESLRLQADKIGSCIEKINYKIDFLEKSLKNSSSDEISKALNSLREDIDFIEKEVDDNLWPLPKYSEMLFVS